jgi:hypothetical protein
VRRAEEERRVALESRLRPVAVVHVPVEDSDARDAERRAGVLRRDTRVRKEAEAHRLRRRRVVPRRSNAAERRARRSAQHRVDRGARCAGGAQRSASSRRHHRSIAVDALNRLLLRRSTEQLKGFRDKRARVEALELIDRRLSRIRDVAVEHAALAL